MTKNIIKKYIVKSEDKYGEKTFEIVKGFHETDNLGNYRKYSYESKYGNCEIIFLDNTLTISRKGDFTNIFEIFFNGEKKEFIYENNMIREVFYSLGEEIKYDKNLKIFSFSYKLLDKNNLEINKISFDIKEMI